MKALLLVLLAGGAQALEIKAPSPNSGTITPSTVTVTGSGSKCFSVDDPTLVVDCNLNKVTIGGSAGLDVTYGISGATGSFSGAVRVTGELNGGAATTSGIFQFGAGPNGFDGARMNMCGSANATCGGTGAIQYFTKGNNTADHIWYTDQGGGNAEKMRLLATGQLGVGTASPATTLDVNGNAQFGSGATKSTFTATGNLFLAGSGAPMLTMTNASPRMDWIDSDNSDMVMGLNTALFTIDKFGVGTRLSIDLDSGNVGIGNSSPNTALDVTGNAQFGSGATKSTFTATGFWEPISKTRAQIDLLVPTKVGQVIYGSDTTLPGLCISTGTLAAQWRKMESATLGCGSGN